MTQITLIGGTPATASRTAALLDAAARHLEMDFTLHILHIRDLDATELLHGQYDGATVKPALETVAASQGIILATPVYKASYTGVLKTFLDVLPANALAGKVILPLVMGASSAHSLVIDYALKPVLAALGAETILRGLYLIDNQYEHEGGRNLRFLASDAEAHFYKALDGFKTALKERA